MSSDMGDSIDAGAIAKCLRHFCLPHRVQEGGRRQINEPINELRRLLTDLDSTAASELLGNLLHKHGDA